MAAFAQAKKPATRSPFEPAPTPRPTGAAPATSVWDFFGHMFQSALPGIGEALSHHAEKILPAAGGGTPAAAAQDDGLHFDVSPEDLIADSGYDADAAEVCIDVATSPFEAGTRGDPEAARAALDGLLLLPPELQGAAIGKMSDAAFKDLMTSVPEGDRDRFESLFQAAGDVERKVQLWGEFHKARSADDVAAAVAAVGADASLSADEKKLRLEKLAAIEADTRREADDEVAHALEEQERLEHPGLEEMGRCVLPGVQAVSVDEIAQRKAHEHDLEMRYLVNLTNTRDRRDENGMPTTRAVWSENELVSVESALRRLPESALAGNRRLKEIRREGMDWDQVNGKWKPSPHTGGEHSALTGIITITDTGIDGQYRMTGETSVLGGHEAGGGEITALEESLAHEIGHDVAALNPDIAKRFSATANWTDYDQAAAVAAMKKAGMSDADIKTNLETLATGGTVSVGDEELANDPYLDGGYTSYTAGTIPGDDAWDYARTNESDHFAETYTKAVHDPEKLYDDLVEKPRLGLEKSSKARDDAKAALATLKRSRSASPADVAAAEKTLADAEALVGRIEGLQDARGEQWRLMREEVFGVSGTSIEAAAAKIDRRHRAAFLDEARMVMTPEQLGRLEERYAGPA